ncbi:baeRF6 domain-containing protein [Lactiplantibacillus mudanjiangensis]|uniref:Bacterial archaeo-eukaryotic release factor family 6 domain-containing protein n=1 Tax=Lactiplantibacillus mudanjiangensis TaxID=1296538 RepID=A0A660E300_9LACO|nr:hypothetical protein [Lactiplantibacillus mudanjiangensis]VDG21428.1 hypothetical protein [Lactobacillus sp. CBA3605] [Lactiplantibacillus mudanjiangensis]VDG26110.1 hypothetical protein [Lactobacillus sp. CBA3605] [Lactiplantibacillus mudanjiangensis]VDG29051.1 hypothetical protein [Lactobacillus sp. CBA3605] [Lactiplantibacillus mudanjiangensis]VDG31569.1 hypothetical protein [Lactobacillus sp. CBA3605] [Lactiplantibacillus mudanjiangensis]
MDILVKNDLNQLMQQRDAGPFIAIYLNTDAVLNDLNQRRLQLKELVATAEQQLAQRFPKENFRPFQVQFDRLAADNSWWLQHTGPQTGLIANAHTLVTFDLQTPTEAQVIVNSMPAIRPILADRQQQFDFDLLALNETSMAMYQHRESRLIETPLPADAPIDLKTTLGTEKRGGDLNFNSSPAHGVNYHGHNAKAEEREIDQRNYYQQVDQYILDHYSKSSQRPLILIGLPHNQAVFRKLSKNPYLSQHLMLDQSPNGLDLPALQEAVKPLQDKWHTQLTDILLSRYDQAQSRKLALADPFDMIKPALAGRIDTLIVASNAQVSGTLNTTDGSVDTDLPLPDNLIDDLVDEVLSKQGQIRMIPADRMPTETAALALLRY